jgi:hypothetical protein
VSLVSVSNSLRVVVRRQEAPRDLGPWCVEICMVGGLHLHIARHTTRGSAMAHAREIRNAFRSYK